MDKSKSDDKDLTPKKCEKLIKSVMTKIHKTRRLKVVRNSSQKS